MVRRKKEDNTKNLSEKKVGGKRNDYLAFFFLFLSFFILVAILFPSGVILEYIGDFLKNNLGIASYVLSAYFFIKAVELLNNRPWWGGLGECLSWILLFVSAPALMALFKKGVFLAGKLGKAVGGVSIYLFGLIGSILVLSTLIIVSFFSIFDLSFSYIYHKLIAGVSWILFILVSPFKFIYRIFSDYFKMRKETLSSQEVEFSVKEKKKERLSIQEEKDSPSEEIKDFSDKIKMGRDFSSSSQSTTEAEDTQKKEKSSWGGFFSKKKKKDDSLEKGEIENIEEKDTVKKEELEKLSSEEENLTPVRKPLAKEEEKIVAQDNEVRDLKKEEVSFSSPSNLSGVKSPKKKEVKEELKEEKASVSAVKDVKVKMGNIPEVPKVKVKDESFLPKIEFLNDPKPFDIDDLKESLNQKANRVIQTLEEFNIPATIENIVVGPSVTRIEIKLAPGIRISKVTKLIDNIGMSLATKNIRIEAPIPGKSSIGIEIPNPKRMPVTIKEIITSSAFQESDSLLSIALGKSVEGEPVVANLAKMPHLLVAGSTGSGKSVCVNSIIISFLYKATSDKLKFLMVDPKMVELSVYDKLPHLLYPPVTEPQEAAVVLNWAVEEMERRYQVLAQVGVRKLESFNELIEAYENGTLDETSLPHDENGLTYFDKNYPSKLPYIVIIIDELADLMMVAKNEVETSITRILQKARAVGIHMIIATQRPSVDVVTGLLKANLPSRIAFAVSSGTDSRTILDATGAERLLGQGDMLYWPIGQPYPQRVQGCFVSDGEIKKIVDYLKKIDDSEYDPSLGEYIRKSKAEMESGVDDDDDDSDFDVKLPQALEVILEANYASTSLIQRKLKVGYSRAGRLMDQLERLGIVGPQRGSKPREILVTPEEARDYVESAMGR